MAYKMLQDLTAAGNIPEFIEQVKARRAILYGFGHRIYKSKDPRGAILRQILNHAKGDVKDPLLDTALELDRLTCNDPWFVSRNLYLNGDLFACFTYTSL
jgi:citrate synthase